jgi:hypothetical protein
MLRGEDRVEKTLLIFDCVIVDGICLSPALQSAINNDRPGHPGGAIKNAPAAMKQAGAHCFDGGKNFTAQNFPP